MNFSTLKETSTQFLSIIRNPLLSFLIKGLVLFLLWDQLFYNHLITTDIHNWVIYRLLDSSKWLLGWFYPNIETNHFNIVINGHRCVHVGIPCNGIDVMGIFTCLILAFKAPWFHKLWMIVCGIAIIFALNSIRASALAAIIINHRKAFDINHKYIFNFILYGILLLIFYLWSSRFGTVTDKETIKQSGI